MSRAWLLSILVLALQLWAVYNVWSSSAEVGPKILWTLVLILLPLLGLIIWWAAGPKK